MINYHNRRFRSVAATDNAEVDQAGYRSDTPAQAAWNAAAPRRLAPGAER
jgi:hypothetical protein